MVTADRGVFNVPPTQSPKRHVRTTTARTFGEPTGLFLQDPRAVREDETKLSQCGTKRKRNHCLQQEVDSSVALGLGEDVHRDCVFTVGVRNAKVDQAKGEQGYGVRPVDASYVQVRRHPLDVDDTTKSETLWHANGSCEQALH
jgi:hypothetical protein